MSEKFIRIYKKMDIDDVGKHLLIYGDLSASCGNCKAMNIKIDVRTCPECKTEFRYIAFRNIKQNMPKVHKTLESSPEIQFVDFDDYKRLSGALKAERFLK